MTYQIQKHMWVDGQTATYCKYCDSRSGQGFYAIVDCTPRFNEEGFKSFLEFRNMSKVDDDTYIRRFTNQTFLATDLLKEFKESCEELIPTKGNLTINNI